MKQHQGSVLRMLAVLHLPGTFIANLFKSRLLCRPKLACLMARRCERAAA
jgi:hypothetical protein